MSMASISLSYRLAEAKRLLANASHALERLENKETPYGLGIGILVKAYTEEVELLSRWLAVANE